MQTDECTAAYGTWKNEFNFKSTSMKTLRCRDAGFNCDKEIHAQTEEGVLTQAAEHAEKVHNVKVTPEMANKIKTLIRSEADPANA